MLSEVLTQKETLVPTLIAGLIGLAVYSLIIYPLYFAPLSKVPGPKISAITEWWILYKTWNEERIRLVHRLHEEYGPIVRLSPREISVSDPEHIKTIYTGNYDKSTFYGQFGAFNRLNTFSSLTKTAHIKRRKLLNQFYSKSSICSPSIESRTQKRISDTMSYIVQNRSPTVEVYNLFHALAMDTVTNFLLGDDNGSSFLKTGDWSMIEFYRLQSSMWFWTTLMPRFYDYTIDKATSIAVKSTAVWCKESTLNTISTSLEPESVVGQLNKNGITGLDACAEIQDHSAAGHETTGATLSFLTYHLSISPDIQERLHKEIIDAFGASEGETIDSLPYKEVDSLPYLNGVVMETLRLYSAIPGAEPRVVPPSGMRATNELTIPGGTIVSIQPWTVHRDANVYTDPLKFDPERWMNSSPEQLKLMNRNFMAFGAGVRMCIGMNLALQEIKLIVASIYRTYRTETAPGFDGEDKMYIVDKYTTHPKGHECLLNFYPRN